MNMKKLLVLSFVAGMLVLASCGTGKGNAEATDSTKVVEQPVAVDSAAVADSAVVK
jgi:hypothetical protein